MFLKPANSDTENGIKIKVQKCHPKKKHEERKLKTGKVKHLVKENVQKISAFLFATFRKILQLKSVRPELLSIKRARENLNQLYKDGTRLF